LVGDREIKSTGDGHNHYQQWKTECQLAGLLI
jgi:hypothetical protein